MRLRYIPIGCFVAAALATIPTVGPAMAQAPSCVKRADLVKHLAHSYQESTIAVGLADNGGLVEVFSSPDGATWTVAVSMPNGVSCMIATGQNWQAVEPKPIEDDPA